MKQYFTYNEINFLINALEDFYKNIIYTSNLNLKLIELFEKSLENNNEILLVNIDRLQWKLEKLNEVKPSQYNNVSIVIDTKQELDIVSKLELKDRIYKVLKDIDININNVY